MDEHYYTENPSSQINEREFSCTVRNATLLLTSVSGVFAFGEKVDKASRLLIENFQPSGKSVLDMGCGYGPIGLFIKSLYPNLKVTLVDINKRAVKYAKLNAARNRLEISVIQSDLFSEIPHELFDDIVSNPPIAAGKALNKQLIHESLNHLNPGGSLWMVSFHNKGGSTLKGIMKSAFGNVEDVYKSGGIRVYKAVRQL